MGKRRTFIVAFLQAYSLAVIHLYERSAEGYLIFYSLQISSIFKKGNEIKIQSFTIASDVKFIFQWQRIEKKNSKLNFGVYNNVENNYFQRLQKTIDFQWRLVDIMNIVESTAIDCPRRKWMILSNKIFEWNKCTWWYQIRYDLNQCYHVCSALYSVHRMISGTLSLCIYLAIISIIFISSWWQFAHIQSGFHPSVGLNHQNYKDVCCCWVLILIIIKWVCKL